MLANLRAAAFFTCGKLTIVFAHSRHVCFRASTLTRGDSITQLLELFPVLFRIRAKGIAQRFESEFCTRHSPARRHLCRLGQRLAVHQRKYRSGVSEIRREEAMKTAGNQNRNRWTRRHSRGWARPTRNTSSSITWAGSKRNSGRGKSFFFLTSPSIEHLSDLSEFWGALHSSAFGADTRRCCQRK